ncbi:MAG: NUMOD4 domain-containing protein [Candidatus Cyclobacteriaceae bacterium M3_2C_046]
MMNLEKEKKIYRVERMDEIFKPIEGFPKYQVSNLGRIRSFTQNKKQGKIMKQRIHPEQGYFMLDLIDDEGKRRTVYPHKEVAKAFCINVLPEERTVVVHLDGNLKNNNSTNLDWCTYSESIRNQIDNGNRDTSKTWETRRKLMVNGKTKNGKARNGQVANGKIPKKNLKNLNGRAS